MERIRFKFSVEYNDWVKIEKIILKTKRKILTDDYDVGNDYVPISKHNSKSQREVIILKTFDRKINYYLAGSRLPAFRKGITTRHTYFLWFDIFAY